MFSKKFLFLSFVVAGVLVTGCRKEPKITPAPKVSFNISGADALGGRKKNSARSASGARAADNSGDSALVKIMEDGTLESALNCKITTIEGLPQADMDRMTQWGKLTDVFLPPKDSNCSDVYLLFDNPTWFPAEYEPNHVGHWSLSNLLCIHEDNTWTDLMYDSPWDLQIFPIDSKKNIQIAEDGSLCVLYREGGGWEYYIRKYDPATKTVKEICRFGRSAPLVEETVGWTNEDWLKNYIFINKMEISKDGKWAYIQIIKTDIEYIHVVSIDEPSNSVDIILDATDSETGMRYSCWDYDEITNALYYLKIQRDENDSSKITKQAVCKVDCDGKNPVEVAALETINQYMALTAMNDESVWIKYEEFLSAADGNTNSTVIFENVKTGEKKEVLLPTAQYSYYCGDNYIVKGDYIYSCYGTGDHDLDTQAYKTNVLFSFSVKDKSVLSYTDSIPEKTDIAIATWNVGEEKLYISGKSNEEPVNYAINLDGSASEKIAEGQVFTCIGSLK